MCLVSCYFFEDPKDDPLRAEDPGMECIVPVLCGTIKREAEKEKKNTLRTGRKKNIYSSRKSPSHAACQAKGMGKECKN